MIVIAILTGTLAFVILVMAYLVWEEKRRTKKSLIEGFQKIIDEISSDKVMLSIVRLMIKKNELGLDSDEIAKEAGSELKAKMIIDRLLKLCVWSGYFRLYVFRRYGGKIIVDPRWIDAFPQ